MADDAITWGGIGGLGSPVYICGDNLRWSEHDQHVSDMLKKANCRLNFLKTTQKPIDFTYKTAFLL